MYVCMYVCRPMYVCILCMRDVDGCVHTCILHVGICIMYVSMY